MVTETLNETVFGLETEFDGTLSFSDNLVITGKFTGTINSTGVLEIDKTAVCKVDVISAKTITVYGRVTGNLEAEECVELCHGSKVTGNITAAAIRISDNVEFEGEVHMIETIPNEDIFNTLSEEYKNSLVLKGSEKSGS